MADLTEKLEWKLWSKENREQYSPLDMGKSEGRGERMYVWELQRRGLPSRQNTPGQNPDVLIDSRPGREVKELRGWTVRLSGADDVKLSVYDIIVEPLLKRASSLLDKKTYRKFKILGEINARNLRSLGDVDSSALITEVFRHSDIDHLVIVSERGYMELSLEDSIRSFHVYKLHGLVPSLFMKNEVRPET